MKVSAALFLTDILPIKRKLIHRVVKNKILGSSPAEKAFAEMRKYGVEGIELLLPSFATTADIAELKEAVELSKLRVLSVHQALRFFTKTALPEIEKLFEIAKQVSAKVIVLHMSSVRKQVFDKEFVIKIHEMQKKYGIKAGFENSEKHVGSVMSSDRWDEKNFASLMKRNNFYITLDICHLGQAGGDIISFFKDNKDRIINIHVSDYKAHYLNNSLRPLRFKHLPLGKGTLPIGEFLHTLKKENYMGLLTMEIHTDLPGLLESAQIIKNAT